MAMEEEFDMGEANEDELAGLKTVGDAVNFVASTLTNGVPRILLARRTISVLPTPVGPIMMMLLGEISSCISFGKRLRR